MTEHSHHQPDRVYFRVPNFTGYGWDFDTYAEALAYTADRWHSPYVQQSIEVRVSDVQGDRQLHRFGLVNPLLAAQAAS